MASPSLGYGYLLWLRLRWAIAAMLIVLVLASVTALLFPATREYCQGGSMALVMFSLAPLLNAFTFGPVDLGVRTSGFPTHMLVLPQSTRALVGWPMLYGGVIHAILWVLTAILLFIPFGDHLPILWPATSLAALCVWVQAIGWSTFSSPYTRVPALVLALVPIVLLAFILGPFLDSATSSAVIVAWNLIWILAAYSFGVWGLSRARTGRERSWYQAFSERLAPRFRQKSVVERARAPFRSAFSAQFWHECRRNAGALPIMLTLIGLPLLGTTSLSMITQSATDNLRIGSVAITPSILGLAVLTSMPIVFGAMFGNGMAKMDLWGKEQMSSFFAIRPLTTLQFILIKVGAMFVSAVACSAILLSFTAVWAIVDVSPLNAQPPSLVRTAFDQATPRTAAFLLASLIGFVLLIWRNILVGMWQILIGRKWISTTIAIIAFSQLVVVGLAAAWVYHHPEVQPELPRFVPWFVGGLIAEKVCGAVAVGVAVRKWDLYSRDQVAILYAAWFLIASLLFAAACCFVSPSWMLAAGVALALPFARLAAMPVALSWNRHR